MFSSLQRSATKSDEAGSGPNLPHVLPHDLGARSHVRRVAVSWVVALTILAATVGAVALGRAFGERVLFAPTAATPVQPLAPGLPGPRLIPPKITPTVTRAGTTAVWVFGDSICSGQGLPATQAWPARLALRAALTVVNWCRPGYAFSGYLGNVSDELAAAYASGLTVPSTVIVAAGTNDLPIHDSASILASELAALDVHKSLLAHGAHRVLFAAVIPRGDGYEQLRQQFNLWEAVAFGADYQAVDFFFNPVGPALFVKYYQPDKLHPNATGAQLIADTFDASKVTAKVPR